MSKMLTPKMSFSPPPRGSSLHDTTAFLRSLLLEAINKQSSADAKAVEELMVLSEECLTTPLSPGGKDAKKWEALFAHIYALSPKDLALAASTFNMMLTLENIAEDLELRTKSEEAAQEGIDAVTSSTAKTVKTLLEGGIWGKPRTPEAITAALQNIEFDIVFTAHPTQVMRKSLLQKCQEMRSLLHDLQTVQLSPHDQEETLDKLKEVIHMCWRTDELRRKAPTPTEEMRGGLSYIRGSIFPAVPMFLRRLDKMLISAGLPPYPLDKSPFRFCSWMGGDRDGNPNVTATITKEVVITARIEAATVYIEAMQDLMSDLSMWRATPEFLEHLERAGTRFTSKFGDNDSITKMRRSRGYNAFFSVIPTTEPYRKMLAEVRERLWDTRDVLNKWLLEGGAVPDSLKPKAQGQPYLLSEVYGGPYATKEEVLEPLLAIYKSLEACGDQVVAKGRLTDLIRQVNCLGLPMTKLDVRQESTRHAEAMDAITRYLGLGSYMEWPEKQRVEFLEKELSSKRPLVPAAFKKEVDLHLKSKVLPSDYTPLVSDDVREVLATFSILATLPLDSFNTYVISMAQAGSDVLAVRLLQKEFGVPDPMIRVAPLFETLDDLDNAPSSLRTLLECETYRKNHIIGNVQEVMIGYSDSGKDAGRLAAAWGLYETQEKLCAVAKEFGVDLVYFHGRGGTVGRGGGPVQLAVRSQPAGTIQNGKMRVTVQGEVIERQFGEYHTACSTLDTYLAAMLEAEMRDPAVVKPEWRALMQEMQKTSCEAYRQVVFRDPRFIEYFRDVTPSAELGKANIGSRPARRKAVDSVASIRAIPWIFAWTQTRFNLPVWLGVGDAFRAARANPAHWETLKDMYQNFIFFRVLVDLLEMVFAKSDPDIAKLYDSKLATSTELKEMGEALRANFKETQAAILNLAGHDELLHGDLATLNIPEQCKERKMNQDLYLKEKIEMRSVFVTPLNLMQVRCLLESREAAKAGVATTAVVNTAADMAARTPHDLIQDALLLTVKGISAGLQNTG